MKPGIERRNKILMGISGAAGLTFFLLAHFSNIFLGLNVIAGCIQITINAFVFFTWKQGYREAKGLVKLFKFCGTVTPIGMATLTLCRVLIPAAIKFLSSQ